MIERSKKTNLLEQSLYRYSLQDIENPNLYRQIYPYDAVPKVTFNHRHVPINMPNDIWITDTTFRDGQQSRAPYEVHQIVDDVPPWRPKWDDPPDRVFYVQPER